ncbi:guanine deaminase [Anaeramoeba flamelloides]|uniref:Guanine deaminase n=1 Tax=Anaeramoeba flamelloides TaxID=1746091 RepID=A0ABQ8YS93_9EUKA|nr:guanine deaminase [Anaeramoeba flamelloides]
MQTVQKLFVGSIFHTLGLNKFAHLPQHLLGISPQGKVLFVSPKAKENEIYRQFDINGSTEIIDLGRKFLVPGFVDTHVHAPQYPNAGKGTHLSLIDWLNKLTFPFESKFDDLRYSKSVYEKVVSRLLRNGTTTACYFATIYPNSSKQLADIMNKQGQRGLVGKVNMNRNSPHYYIESTEESLLATEEFINYVKGLKNDTIEPVVTPRFVPTCDPELLMGLSFLAVKHKLAIQSHVAEHVDEVSWVKELEPDCVYDTLVYKKYDLLHPRTILAHAIFLTPQEKKMFEQSKAAISHCPNSNFTISAGKLDLRDLLNRGIKVGLGSDISGGYSPSLLQAQRDSITCSKALAFETQNKEKEINYQQAFYLATLGGAQALGLEHKIGNFEVGKEFDAILVDPKPPIENSSFDVFPQDSIDDIFQKWFYLGDDRNVSKLFVKGKQVL